MMGLPYPERKYWTQQYGALFRDKESQEGAFAHPAGYMFKNAVDIQTDDPIGYTLAEMDKFGIEKGLLTMGSEDSARAVREHPDRFVGCYSVDPNKGMEGVADLVRAYETLGVKAAAFFPCGAVPQVAINDKKMYPLYAKCIELDIPIFVNAGMPGPRFPYEPQYVGLADEVCWFFPELRLVFRHGCEPWTDLAIKLLLKWPNLYYSTSAFAPKYFPKDVVEFANTRGADKVIYAGYYPSGLSLERSFSELPNVPFRDHVWPKFLRENAMKVLKL